MRFVFLLLVTACSSWPSNPLQCTVSQACYDCMKTTCTSELSTAESACKAFIDCRLGSCTDTSCPNKATGACESANKDLVQCEARCSVCPGK